MISIYLCEDNVQQLEHWNEIIRNFLLMNNLNEDLVLATPDPTILLKHLTKHPPEIGLYFLDIDLGADINGLTLATKIRKYDPRGYIVFITTHMEMSYMTFTYKVEAMDFILKDHVNDLPYKICQCMLQANNNYKRMKLDKQELLPVKIGGETILLDSNEIIRIETSDTIHKVEIHTNSSIKSVYGTLKEFEAALDKKHFYRCHKSIIVNTNHIREINRRQKNILLSNGEVCDISSRYLKKLETVMRAR